MDKLKAVKGRLSVAERKQKRTEELEREEVCKANAPEVSNRISLLIAEFDSISTVPL